MTKRRRLLPILGAVVIASSLTGCVLFDDKEDSPTETDDASTPPPEVEYSVEADEMKSWDDDLCALFGAVQVIDQFEAPLIEETTWRNEDAGTGAPLVCHIVAVQEASHFSPLVELELAVSPYNSNVEAWENYPGYRWRGLNGRHLGWDEFADHTIDIAGSIWVQGVIDSTDASSSINPIGRQVLVEAQSDFYLVEMNLEIDSDGAFRAGCDPGGEDDCVMTAEFMAEYLAEQYLPSLHQAIENRLAAS